jgi:DNA-binding phage protein
MSTPTNTGGNTMLRWEQIVEGLKDRKLKVVAAETGLAYNTLHRIVRGGTTNPTLHTMTVLSEYLLRKPGA